MQIPPFKHGQIYNVAVVCVVLGGVVAMVGSGEDVGTDEDVARLLIVELLSIKLEELVAFEATGLPVLASDNEGTDDTVSDEKVEAIARQVREEKGLV